jgi:hypothetical protein
VVVRYPLPCALARIIKCSDREHPRQMCLSLAGPPGELVEVLAQTRRVTLYVAVRERLYGWRARLCRVKRHVYQFCLLAAESLEAARLRAEGYRAVCVAGAEPRHGSRPLVRLNGRRNRRNS